MDKGKSTRICSKTTKEAKERDEETVDWSKLPVDLLGLIVLRLFSLVELIRFRSICSSWRSSVSNANDLVRSHPLIHLKPLVVLHIFPGNNLISDLHKHTFLSRAAFFRVSLSSSPNQGWLIKSDVDINFKKLNLLNCLSRVALKHSRQSLDLLAFTVSEIREVYEVKECFEEIPAPGFRRVVIVKDAGGDHYPLILVIGSDGKIRNWNLSGRKWSRVPDQIAHFTDIIVHKGLTYALDSKGIIWWISSSCNIYRYGPSLYENITSSCCRDMRFVECCGELYIVERLEKNVRKRKVVSSDDDDDDDDHGLVIHDDVGNVIYKSLKSDSLKTVGFKVYKMDEEVMKWLEVKSLGDYAFVMATDCSFSVKAHEFYGCLQNSVYFIHNKEDKQIKVFKLDDGSITTIKGFSQSCFQMFVPSFL